MKVFVALLRTLFRGLVCCGKTASFLIFLATGLPFAAYSGLLLEEGFNYSPGSNLATNSPWLGTAGSSLAIVDGGLSYSLFADIAPSGNMLQISGGASRNNYRNFSATPVSDGAVYLSALINCSLLPTNSQFVGALLAPGIASSHQPDDPLDLYFTTTTNGGYRLRVTRNGSDPATASKILTSNTTYLVVLKYTFGTNGRTSLFIDPAPGAPEPGPNASTQLDDDTTNAPPNPNLQVILFHSPSLASQGSWNIDTVRVGTNWSDVMPLQTLVSVSGPVNQTVCSGNPATFSVATDGTPPFTYQWRRDGSDIPGATDSELTLDNPTPADALVGYSVVVANNFGSTTSRVATLSISTVAPSIGTPPVGQTLQPGSNATFTVVSAGDQPLAYQWRTNGVPIPGATNDSYTIVNPTDADAGNVYDVIVSNPCGSVTSSPPATLLVAHSFYACDGLPGFFYGMNLFTTNLEGMSLFAWSSVDPNIPLSLWTLEGPLSEQPLNDGSGSSRYSINVNPLTSLVYYLIGQTTTGPFNSPVPLESIATDEFGGYLLSVTNVPISSAGVLEFPSPPVISQSPVSIAVPRGGNANFAVIAAGSPPLTFQWYFNGMTLLANGTNSTLSINGIADANAGIYSVIVSNPYGSVTSAPATLTIQYSLQLTAQKNNGAFQLSSFGVPGDAFWIQAAPSLNPPINWTIVTAGVVAANGVIQFTDTNMVSVPQRFYRLVFPSLAAVPPIIFQQPSGKAVLAGKGTSLVVGVTGTEPLFYQWYSNTNPVPDGTNATLTIRSKNFAGSEQYFAIVTNIYGSATSIVASISIVAPPQLSAHFDRTSFVLNAFAVPGDTCLVESTTNLIPPLVWTTLATNVADKNGLIQFTETNPGFPAQHYYRLMFP